MNKDVTKKMMKPGFWLVSVIAALLNGCATETPSAPPMTDQAAAYVEHYRAEIREDKVVFINESMNLKPEDHYYNAFWHEYYPYEAELKKINDERLALNRDYAFNYSNINESTANNLAVRALAIHKKRLELLEKYYEKIKQATSPLIAARFLQVEHVIKLLLDIEIASETPLMPVK